MSYEHKVCNTLGIQSLQCTELTPVHELRAYHSTDSTPRFMNIEPVKLGVGLSSWKQNLQHLERIPVQELRACCNTANRPQFMKTEPVTLRVDPSS